jgi:signal transduction histidine kinase
MAVQDEIAETPAEEATLARVVLASADPRLSRRLAEVLTIAGYEVTCAADGVDALDSSRRQQPAVVITDLDLPRLDGVGLVSELQALEPSTECLLIATPADIERVVEAHEAGNVYNHYWKPIQTLDEILRGIGRALERRSLRLSEARLLTELREAREEIGFFHSRLEQLDKVTALGHMVTTISRELESPMIGLLGYAQFLRARLERSGSEPLTAEQVDRVIEYMSEMEQGVRKCYTTVKNVREYSSEQPTDSGPTSVHEVLYSALALVRPSLEAQDIQVDLELSNNLPAVLAHPRRLQQTLLSVLVNAQQAMGRSGGAIVVATDVVAGKGGAPGVRIQISDTGTGIPACVLPHIYDTFFSTRSRSEGLGLGLTIARRMVEGWQGTIQVDSVYDEGTIVSIWLPICAEVAASPDESEESRSIDDGDSDRSSWAA